MTLNWEFREIPAQYSFGEAVGQIDSKVAFLDAIWSLIKIFSSGFGQFSEEIELET